MPYPRSCGEIDARLCMRREMARSCVTLRGGCAVLAPPQRSAPIEASFWGRRRDRRRDRATARANYGMGRSSGRRGQILNHNRNGGLTPAVRAGCARGVPGHPASGVRPAPELLPRRDRPLQVRVRVTPRVTALVVALALVAVNTVRPEGGKGQRPADRPHGHVSKSAERPPT